MYRFLPKKLQPIFNSPIRRATIESVMTGVAGQAVLVVSGILVARALGPEKRGYLALLVIFPVILSQIGSLGLPQAATYFIAMNRDDARVIYNRLKVPILGQVLVLLIIHLVIVSLYVRHESKEVIMAGYLSIAVIPGMLFQQYGLAVLQGYQMYRSFNVMRLMPATMYAILILSIFLAQVASLPSITFLWVCSCVVVGVFTAYLATYRVLRLTENNNRVGSPTLPKMFKFGLKGLLGTVSPMQNFQLDQLVAGLFLSPAALGLYVVGQAFTNLVRFIAQSAGMVVYPAVAANENNATAKKLIRRFFFSVAVMNGLVVLALIAVIPVLVPFFFGKAFVGSIPIARLLLLGAYFESLRRILVEGMRGMGRPEVSTWAELSMYPLFAILAPILISHHGLIGLAATVILCYFLSLLVALIFFKFSEKSKQLL
jgi:O-antigen/teichoic acid export membrane protein